MRNKLAAGSLAVVIGFLLATNPGVVNAAGRITGKQIKDGSISIKDIKPSTVSQLRGQDGANGANGTNGMNGTNGASAFAPPPAGTVIKGGGIQDNYTSALTELRSYAPLPFTTKTPLVDGNSSSPNRNLWLGSTPLAASGQVNTTACSGSFANPTATPGNLCVYINPGPTNVATGTVGVLGGSLFSDEDGAQSSGFFVDMFSAGAGQVLYRYTWAYTAN